MLICDHYYYNIGVRVYLSHIRYLLFYGIFWCLHLLFRLFLGLHLLRHYFYSLYLIDSLLFHQNCLVCRLIHYFLYLMFFLLRIMFYIICIKVLKFKQMLLLIKESGKCFLPVRFPIYLYLMCNLLVLKWSLFNLNIFLILI